MNKILIPSSVVVLIASIPVAYKAIALDDADLMVKAYMLAALSAAVFLLLLLDYLIRGLHNLSNLEEIAIAEEELEQRYQVEQLYENKEHSDDFLSGFALAAEFFIENYLSEETPGPTEKKWYRYITKAYHDKFIDTAPLYRTYMMHALMNRGHITSREYEKIARMTASDAARRVYSTTYYESSTTDEDIRNATGQLKEQYEKAKQENKDR